MSQFTEDRIKRLCEKTMAVQNQEDAERVLEDLRVAIADHLRLAKEGLLARAAKIPNAS